MKSWRFHPPRLRHLFFIVDCQKRHSWRVCGETGWYGWAWRVKYTNLFTLKNSANGRVLHKIVFMMGPRLPKKEKRSMHVCMQAWWRRKKIKNIFVINLPFTRKCRYNFIYTYNTYSMCIILLHLCVCVCVYITVVLYFSNSIFAAQRFSKSFTFYVVVLS